MRNISMPTESISFDYAIAENLKTKFVPCDMGWSDVRVLG